ncbi:mucoidy inhibitor MuiA family protein [Rhizocola hellebori]|nr:mucoidy inhibitor MuiA family protein [Rhizocola hellebori]
MTQLEAPIVAVTVFPDRARITRRGTVSLTEGEHRVRSGALPMGLLHDSVRVAGIGAATVLGVDVKTRRRPQSSDAQVAELDDRIREIQESIDELVDADAVATGRERFLGRVAIRSAGSFSATDVGRATGFADDIDGELLRIKAAKRHRERERAYLIKEREAAQRRRADMRNNSHPDELVAEVTLDVTQEGDVELELTYVTMGASWHSTYDLRLAGEKLTLNWYGMITQHTTEDWPECQLKLSTARPSGALDVPELEPWYIDRLRPIRPMAYAGGPPQMVGMAASLDMASPAAMPMRAAAKPAPMLEESYAVAEQGPAAATYTPTRPVAVPADGSSHRTVVAQFELDAVLDHITAPVQAQEAILRATVRNTSSHTLPDATAALFHEGDFVGSSHVEAWAPDEERELALGVDDRVRVERELVKRNASKATLGSTRRVDAEYQTTVANHSPRTIRLTVLDQLPVSRDGQITVKETLAKPDPAERSELGVITWKAELEMGARAQFHLGFRVESPKGVDLAGWRD